MDYFLQKVGGRPARQAVTLRRCTPVEAPAVFALQNEVRAAMPHPEQFVPDTLENITGYLRTGVCIGAWQQGRLGAYLILRLCGQSSENYAAFLGVPQSQWQHWANADSAVVHPDWRGNGLQRAMLEAALPHEPQATPVRRPLFERVRALLAQARGDPSQALQHWQRAHDLGEKLAPGHPSRVLYTLELAEARDAARQPERVRPLLVSLRSQLTGYGEAAPMTQRAARLAAHLGP